MAHTVNKNTVQSALSQFGIEYFEILLRWYWDTVDHESLSAFLMDILTVYVEHYDPKSPFDMRTPADVTRFVKRLIETNEQMVFLMNEVKPWDWVEAPRGWGLPTKTDE